MVDALIAQQKADISLAEKRKAEKRGGWIFVGRCGFSTY